MLAACQKSLVCYVARDVKAKVILEAAGIINESLRSTNPNFLFLIVDGPVTPTAHKILTTKSKLVIPDIYACAGSSIVSYFEYLRNLQQIGLPEENALRFSTDIHKSIYKNSLEGQQRIVEGSQTPCNVFAPLDSNFTQNCIDCVYSEVGQVKHNCILFLYRYILCSNIFQEIVTNLESLKLGVDLRSAAYAVAIKNMFRTIFEMKTLI